VDTREEVFAMESVLHGKFASRRANEYDGREFFRLSEDDLRWLSEIFGGQANNFAQAKAYYELEMALSEIRPQALMLEQERQAQISFNRRNGRFHDTRPTGMLLRYKNLQKQIECGHLGKRFSLTSHEHPSDELSRYMQEKIHAIIEGKNLLSFLKVGATGLLGGILISFAKAPENLIPYSMTGGIIGLIGGSYAQANREKKEKAKAKILVEAEIDYNFPRTRGSVMLALYDIKEQKSFLVKEYNESKSLLRNRDIAKPLVRLPDENKIYNLFESKSYYPKVASAITLGFTLGLILGAPKLYQHTSFLEPFKSSLKNPPTPAELGQPPKTVARSKGAQRLPVLLRVD
jgi:hypothetical protein